jgi:hypothetical protein
MPRATFLRREEEDVRMTPSGFDFQNLSSGHASKLCDWNAQLASGKLFLARLQHRM